MSGRRLDFPAMEGCTGCGECCGPVGVRPDQSKVIRRFARAEGVEWIVFEGSTSCGFLRFDEAAGRHICAIYPVRPWACRTFGVIAEMPCSYVPGAVRLSIPADEAIRRRLTDPGDPLLGTVFEGEAYIERLAGIVWRGNGGEGDPPAGKGAEVIREMAKRGIVYGDISTKDLIELREVFSGQREVTNGHGG